MDAMKIKLILAVIVLFVGRAHAQYVAVSGNCELPGQAAVVSGLPQSGTQPLSGGPLTSGSGVMASYPQCLVTVYPAGNSTPVPTGNVYSSSTGTALGNPFTANADGSWVFYVAQGCYDVELSAGTTPPSQLPATKILSGKCAGGGGGGGGGVTGSGTAGNYSIWTGPTSLGNGLLEDAATNTIFNGGGNALFVNEPVGIAFNSGALSDIPGEISCTTASQCTGMAVEGAYSSDGHLPAYVFAGSGANGTGAGQIVFGFPNNSHGGDTYWNLYSDNLSPANTWMNAGYCHYAGLSSIGNGPNACYCVDCLVGSNPCSHATGSQNAGTLAVSYGNFGGSNPAWSCEVGSPLLLPGEVNGAVVFGVGGSWTASTAPALNVSNATNFPTLNQNTTGTAGGLLNCSPSTLGDLCSYVPLTTNWQRLAGNETSTPLWLQEVNGVLSWSTPGSGGNVSTSGTNTNGYLSLFTGNTTITSSQYLPSGNFPALTGDVTTSAGSVATTVGKVNGGSIPASKVFLGSSSSSQLVDSSGSISGDVTATSAGAVTVAGLQGKSLPALSAFSSNPYLTYSGSAWQAANPFYNASFTGTFTLPITGETQCLQINSSGQVGGTGSNCSAGGGGQTFVLTGVTQNTPSSGQATYTGTITGGTSNGFQGYTFTIAGFSNSNNNITGVVLSSTATTLVLTNSATTESHAATATLASNYVIGPLTATTQGDIPLINNTTGTLISDSGYSFPLANARLSNSTIGIAGTSNQITSSTLTPALGASTTLALANPLTIPGPTTFAAGTSSAPSFLIPNASAPVSAPNTSGQTWNNAGTIQVYDGLHVNSLATTQTNPTAGQMGVFAGTTPVLTPTSIGVGVNDSTTITAYPGFTLGPLTPQAFTPNATLGPTPGSNNNYPIGWIQNADSTWDTQFGIDTYCSSVTGPLCTTGSGSGPDTGRLVFYKGFRVNDSKITPQGYNNAFVAIRHLSGVGTVTSTNQEQGLVVNNQVQSSDSATHYGVEGVQAETDWNSNNAAWGGTVDGEVSSGTFATADQRTANDLQVGAAVGFVGSRSVVNNVSGTATCGSSFRVNRGPFSGGNEPSACYTGGYFRAVTNHSNNSSSLADSIGVIGVHATVENNLSGDTGSQIGIGLVASAAQYRFGTANFDALFVDTGSNTNDFNIFSSSTALGNGKNYFGGPVLMEQPMGTGLATGQLPSPTTAPVITKTGAGCSGSSTSWAYAYSWVDASGQSSAISSIASTTVGGSTLSGTCYYVIQIPTTITSPTGAYCANFYRTTAGGTPATTGYIGQICGPNILEPLYPGGNNTFLDDTGLTATGTVPSTNSTGGVTAAGPVTAPSFIGAGTGLTGTAASLVAGTATNATNIATTGTTANATYYVPFVPASSSGNQAAGVAAGLGFNPGTGTMTVGGSGTPAQWSGKEWTGTSVTVPSGLDFSFGVGSDNVFHCQLAGGGSCGGGGGGVTSINGTAGAFTFSGSGQSCTGTTCTFSGGGITALNQLNTATATANVLFPMSSYNFAIQLSAPSNTSTLASVPLTATATNSPIGQVCGTGDNNGTPTAECAGFYAVVTGGGPLATPSVVGQFTVPVLFAEGQKFNGTVVGSLDSTSTHIASGGIVSLANTDTINWSNAGNTADLPLGVNTSNQLTFNGSVVGGSSGVSSFSGDGTLLSNSSSTGTVTATLANAGAHKWWGNNTGSSATPGYESLTSSDLPLSSMGTITGGTWNGTALTSTYLPSTTVYTGQANAYTTGLQDFSSATFKLPIAAAYAPTTAGLDGYNSTTNAQVWGNGTTTLVGAVAATGTNVSTTCTNQVFTVISGTAAPTCTSLSSSFLPLASMGTITGGTWQGGVVGSAYGGTGVNNTATLTLGTSNRNYATLGTGIEKNTTSTGAVSNAAASDVVALFGSGSCSGYLKNDGTCGSPTVSKATNGGSPAQALSSGAANYLTDCNLTVGTSPTTGTTMHWVVSLSKTATTGSSNSSSLVFYGGTNGSTSDTPIATVTAGSLSFAGTAATDNGLVVVDVSMTGSAAGVFTVYGTHALNTTGLASTANFAVASGTIATTSTSGYQIGLGLTTGTSIAITNNQCVASAIF